MKEYLILLILTAIGCALYYDEYCREIRYWRALIVRQDPAFIDIRLRTRSDVWDALVEINDHSLIALFVATHDSIFGEYSYLRSKYCHNPYIHRSRRG